MGRVGRRAVPPVLLVGVIAVGAVVLALSWYHSAGLRPVAAAGAALLLCAAGPGPHTTTALLLAVPVLAVLAAAVVDAVSARSTPARWAVLGAVLVAGAATCGPVVTAAVAPDIDRTALGTWVRAELGGGALQVDPLAAAQLVRDGVPAARLVPAAIDAPGGTLSVVGTPPAASPPDSQMLVAFPDGPAGTPTAVFRPGLGADRAVERRRFGSQLVGNRALTLSPVAAEALRRGEVDSRLTTMLAGLASDHRLTIGEFGTVPGEPAGAARRTAVITAADGVPSSTPGATEPIRRWLDGQRPPYRPATVVLDQGVLVVHYTIASGP